MKTITDLPKTFLDMTVPRGIRNNNPLNIRINKYLYDGEVPSSLRTDKSFKQFFEMKFGLLAAYKLLQNSYINKGYNTIEKIVNRWAPPSENATLKYIDFVSTKTKISKNKQLIPGSYEYKTELALIIQAMTKKETSYSMDLKTIQDVII